MPNFPDRGLRRSVLSALAVAPIARVASAQESWPSRPPRIVVPYPVGGSTDIVARHLAEQLTRELGQPVLVDNRPGGGTNIGAESVVNAKPDGYTVLFGGVGQVTNPVFGPIPSFDLLTALEPVGLVASSPFVVAANPKVPIGSARELIAAARAKPDALSVSSAQLDIFVELLNSRAGMKLLHVPYKGGAQAATDAIGGQVDMVFAQVPALLTHLQSGRLKALAVTSARRFPGLPEIPSFAELGVDYDVTPWFGLLAPAGTPKTAIDRLTRAMQTVIAGTELAQKIRAAGAEPGYGPPEVLRARLRDDLVFWQQVAKLLPHLVQK